MNALLFLAMLAALIAGCFWFVWTLPSAAPELPRRSWPEPEQHHAQPERHERGEAA